MLIAGLCISLLVVCFQDWKSRRIHLILPVLIFSLSFFLVPLTAVILLKCIIYNITFFVITFSILVAYMSFKNKQFTNPFAHYFGLGDLLFYMAIAPLFLLKNYIVFFILSMIFAVLLQTFLQKRMLHNSVPLAGFASLFLLLVILKDILLYFPKITLL